jgi:hypothetical protein
MLGSKKLRLEIFKLTHMEKNTKQLGGKFVVSKGWTYLKYERFLGREKLYVGCSREK